LTSSLHIFSDDWSQLSEIGLHMVELEDRVPTRNAPSSGAKWDSNFSGIELHGGG